jgi:hypothetical protein
MYSLKKKAYYWKKFDGSYRLFNACWDQYRRWLKGSIDDPWSDSDVMNWLDQIASEKVNNSKSVFYIHG